MCDVWLSDSFKANRSELNEIEFLVNGRSNMQLVSVIIPTFNSGKYIHHAIESVVGQTYDNIEIVVVDDGSTDNTVELVQRSLEQSKQKWQLLRLGTNKGPSAARNAGYQAASGSWIQFLDSDDLLMPRKIETEMAVAANETQHAAVVYSPWSWGFLQGGQIEFFGPVRRPFIAGKPSIMCMVGGCRSLLGASLVRRSALSEVGGFDEGLRFWECEEVNVRLSRVGPLVPSATESPQYLWRLRPDEIYIGGPGSRYSSKEVALGWVREVVRAAGKTPLHDLGLSDDDRKLFLNDCTMWGRMIYSQYRPAFKDYLGLVRKLNPNMLPTYPPYVAALSRLVGYETAESLAKLTRQPKTWLRIALSRLGLRRQNMIIDLR
jgi:glycosyltransferase involved in cell wall biosynthesis